MKKFTYKGMKLLLITSTRLPRTKITISSSNWYYSVNEYTARFKYLKKCVILIMRIRMYDE